MSPSMAASRNAVRAHKELAVSYRRLTKVLAAHMHLEPPEQQQMYEEAFQAVDTDKDGTVTFQEIEEWLLSSSQGVGGFAGSIDSLRLLFEMIDADGSGALDKGTEASLFFKVLFALNRCNHCHVILDPCVDEGYRCLTCQQAAAEGTMDPSDCTSLCRHCYQHCTRTGTPCCMTHPKHDNIKPSSESGPEEPPVVALQLVIPGGAAGLQCSCCGEYHDIVRSYLDADEVDLHMRPTKDGGGFLCEWCAVRVCGCSSNNMRWVLERPEQGLAARRPHSCSAWLGSCRGTGTAKGWAEVEKLAKTRHAAKCRTCAGKLKDGLPMQEPKPKPDLAAGISGISGISPTSSGEGPPVQINRDTALEVGLIVCNSLKRIGKGIPIAGEILTLVAGHLEIILVAAQAVPYNKAKAETLLRRTTMAAKYVESILTELQREAMSCFSDSQSTTLCAYLEELERAMSKARGLLLRWKEYSGKNKALQKVSQMVLHKMDLDDLQKVDAAMSRVMTDMGAFLTGLMALHQIDFRREVAAALSAAEVVNKEQQQVANMKDFASIQSDLLQVLGGVDELKKQLAEDRELAQQWQQQVLPELKGLGIKIDKLDSAVSEILTDVKEIKKVVHDIDDKMDKQIDQIDSVHSKLEEVNKQLAELKRYFQHMPASSSRRASMNHKMPRLLIRSDSVLVDESSKGSMGSGAFANVRRAKWRGLDVAVKRLDLHGLEIDEAEQVYREALILSHLSHPCIVHFYGLIDEVSPMSNSNSRMMQGGLVMELCDCSLQNLLDKGPIQLAAAINIAWQIAQGLNYIHNEALIKLVHSDLKPQNILIKGGSQVKICDFGISDPIAMSTMMGSFVSIGQYSSSGGGGTLLWTPPEVLAGLSRPGSKVESSVARDIYAFGMILYELLTRKRPFAELGRNPDVGMFVQQVVGSQHSPGIRPTGLQQWQQKMQESDRESGGASGNLAAKLVQLVEQCWDASPSVRPTTLELLQRMDEIHELCSVS